MFVEFFFRLREARVPVTLREYLTLLEALDKELHGYSLEHFYYLARAALVKDERNFDRFDQVFGNHFKGLDLDLDTFEAQVPDEWLRKVAERYLTEEEKALIKSLGGWEQLMETLRERLRAERAPPGRQQVDRDGRDVTVRRVGLQPGGCAHRSGRLPPPPRGEGLGPPRVPRLRRLGGARHAQHEGRAAPAAALHARGR